MSQGIPKRVGVAILFAVSGAWSSQFCVDGKDRLIVTLPIPFALLSTLLFWRSIRAILIVPAVVVVWLAAYMGAMAAGMEMGIVYGILSDYVPMVFGGLIGGFGLSLCAGIFHGRLRWREVGGTSIAGMISALAFGPWLASLYSHLNGAQDPVQPVRLKYAFAIWQATVGTYLYAGLKRGNGHLEVTEGSYE